jgi:pyruvate dehydrogenase phosphatase
MGFLRGYPHIAVGDHIFKLDPIWTSRVFLNANPGFQFTSAKPEDLIPRILTPPYLSNKPDVRHVDLRRLHHPDSDATTAKPESFLIMCSDGLVDLYDARDPSALDQNAKSWMQAASKDGEGLYQGAAIYENRALRILRDGLGGEDTDKVAQWITVEITGKWLDDITVLVVPL